MILAATVDHDLNEIYVSNKKGTVPLLWCSSFSYSFFIIEDLL